MFEYDFFDGDHFITLDIVELNEDNATVTVAISDQGRITQDTYPLFEDHHLDEGTVKDIRYFEYGLYLEKIHLSNFELL